jgi:hypothetical protein
LCAVGDYAEPEHDISRSRLGFIHALVLAVHNILEFAMFSKNVIIESRGGMLALTTPLLGVAIVAISLAEMMLAHAAH